MGERVNCESQNKQGPVPGIIFGDPSHNPYGVIVLHEWWGMNEQIQKEAGEIALQGKLTTLVLDLYRGKVATDREEAGHYMSGLDWPGALEDISGGARLLISRGCSKVAVMGFCMGGALSFAAAALVKEISAAAPFYGIPNPQIADLTTITVPVQAHFGEKDEVVGFSSPADYEALHKRLSDAGVPFQLCTYPAGHGFTNPNNPNYNLEITQQALNRVYAFIHSSFDKSSL